MDEGNSRRSLSPYHEKCFPPYCDNAQQIDKAVVSKMDRGDLEDKYIVFADENLELKKQNRNQERQIQRLQTAIQRQDRLDKKSGLTPTSVMADSNKVAILESHNKNLQAKVKVLKQQLMNHSYIHSKEGRINDAKMKQAQVKTPRELEYNPVPNQTQSARDAKPDRNVAALKMRINELEDQLETQKNKYKARLAQLEKELAALEKEAAKSGTSVNEQLSETSRQVKDNTELIKLRMQAEKQAAELEELREKLQSAEEKTEKLREQLRDSKDKVDDLERQLEKERNKSRSAISQASRGTTHMETIRALEEQIRDLQKEKETLKDTNDKLLQLTQTKSEKSMKMPSGHSIQIHQLEKTLKEKMEELYEKEAKISDLEQQLTEAQKEKSIIAPHQSVKSIQVKQQISELEKALKEKIEELDEKKAQISELEKQLAEAQKEKSIIAPHQSVKSFQVEQQISELEETLKEKIEELDEKKAQISELEKQLAEAQKVKSIIAPSQSVKSIQVEQKSEFEKALKEKIEELDEKKAQIIELEKQLAEAQKEKSIIAPSLSAKSVQAEVKAPSKECEKCADLNEQLTSALMDIDRLKALQEVEAPSKSCENCEDLSKQLTSALMDTAKLKALLERQKTPPPTPKRSESDEALRNLNQRLEEELKKALQELHALRPIAEEHMDNCQKHPPITNSKSVQFPGSTVSFKEAVEVTHKPTPVHSEDSVHSKRTIDSDRYIALTKQLEQALWENERLKKELQERGGDEALKRQNQILEDELNQALRELREVRPIAEEHNKHCSALRTEIITREHCHHAEEHLEPEYAKEVSTGQTIHTMFTAQQASPVPSYSSRGRQPYVSHVSPPPSEHCVKTVDINDPAQRANLVIVSKHDFETVLMQKKKYTTEVEVMEPADDRQSLNCKLEICMFDLDIDNRMMEYLSSIQPEPKVYVEWSFVGLDQRTAPLPAERALFYTNVMYFGPLSSEIKHYLNKVEMPIDLYLVRSSGHPVKVAEGTLDMLQAMEQPNRCFIRSVFLRGKDLPSRYATDRAMATVNCSFILHECCVGDPPFRDQLEVAIGTLYLKNRDGGVVPDHATHIYIEYALLGHCGPDLETDSIPRGEVMKFKHSKKLRVNDENAPHLKAMLEDRDPKLLRFTVCAEPCSLTADTEVETMGHADVNLNEEMIKRGQDLVSSQVPVYSVDGEHLGSLSVTILGIGTLQQIYADGRVKSR